MTNSTLRCRKLFLLVLSCVLISTTAYAQSRAVSGDVRSAADDIPLSGVTVQVKGVSDTNGQYKPASDTLSHSDIWKKIGFFLRRRLSTRGNMEPIVRL